MRSRKTDRYKDLGLLLLRVGLGTMFILHGYPKVFGGPEMWAEVGTATQAVGINFSPVFFGFMAGITELFGGLFLMLGLFFKPALGMLTAVMIVATANHISSGDSFALTSHSIEMTVVFISLFFIGAGKYSLDQKIKKRNRRRY